MMIFARHRPLPFIQFLALWLLGCLMSGIGPSTSFLLGNIRVVRQLVPPTPCDRTTTSNNSRPRFQTTRTRKTECWGKYNRNTPKRTKIDTHDILSYERSLIAERGYSYILGSDETGTGSIAGPLITATCCIKTLSEQGPGTLVDPADLPTVKLVSGLDNGSLIKDSKQLSPAEREQIYQTIVENPQIYAVSVAQRSNTEIDTTNNIQRSKMEAFQESIEDLAQNNLFPHIRSRQEPPTDADTWDDCGCYGIVDGKKAPKLSVFPSFPCRPMVQADKQVYTVALASIVAKVTLDRLFQEWHEEFPQYGFDQNLGYATKEHIEAIHQYGPCPLHRMTFKSLKGR